MAWQAGFDAASITAEVLCPDYSGPDMHKILDAYMQLPTKIREQISAALKDKQEKFAQFIIQECLEQVRDEVQCEYDWKLADAVSTRVLQHFGVE